MSDLLKNLASDPDRMLKALTKMAPLLRKTKEFMQHLQDEKGQQHVTLAKAMFQVFDVVALLAVYQGRHAQLGNEFTEPERMETMQAAVHVLQCLATELGQNLGISEADFDEISDAAKAQADATLELSTS